MVLEDSVARFGNCLVKMSHRGLISYDANEEPPPYVEPGVDSSTENLRQELQLTLNKRAVLPSGALSDGEHYVLVTVFTRLLAVLCFMPTDAQ